MSNRLVLVLIGILGLMIGLTKSVSAAGSITGMTILLFISALFLFNFEKHEEITLVKVGILFLTFLWTGATVTTLLAKNFCN